LLAWKCSQSTFACGLRARRQPPRTRVLNMPQRASTNIGNRAKNKKGGRCVLPPGTLKGSLFSVVQTDDKGDYPPDRQHCRTEYPYRQPADGEYQSQSHCCPQSAAHDRFMDQLFVAE